MDDENCKECSDCQSVFTAWRRKHHCRICGEGEVLNLHPDELIFIQGQIFCSRCASNIINGARFGHDGTIRVCNICLEKLAKVDSDEEDDRRSIVSSMTSPFPAHQLGLDSLPNAGRHPQSPFAAAQLFGRTDEPFNLYSIAETKRPVSNMDEKNSIPLVGTPENTSIGSWQFARDTPAPFRRGVSEEEKEVLDLPNGFAGDDSPTAIGTKTPIDFPIGVPASVEGSGGTSSIQFPLISPDAQGLDSPRPGSRFRSRFNSHGDFDSATPFIRSRAQSRLDMIGVGDPGWRTRRESTACDTTFPLSNLPLTFS
jgi:1-phosphatidylinositol-3-phosphate 5-kinase